MGYVRQEKTTNTWYTLTNIVTFITIFLLSISVIGYRFEIFSVVFSLLTLTKYAIYSSLLALVLSLSNLEHNIGVNVNATMLENITAKDRTTPNSINNLPVLPPINDNGRKTETRTSVVAITTKVICLAPSIDALKDFSPFSILLFIFSNTTIESSTINPIANTRAKKVRTFNE